jgi:hypothetical protein
VSTYGGHVPGGRPTPIDISDDELTRLALAADPDQPIADDAVPFSANDGAGHGLLPEWYMPAPSLRRSTRRSVVLASFAIALFVINVGGVCVTYGIPDPVWK